MRDRVTYEIAVMHLTRAAWYGRYVWQLPCRHEGPSKDHSTTTFDRVDHIETPPKASIFHADTLTHWASESGGERDAWTRAPVDVKLYPVQTQAGPDAPAQRDR